MNLKSLVLNLLRDISFTFSFTFNCMLVMLCLQFIGAVLELSQKSLGLGEGENGDH